MTRRGRVRAATRPARRQVKSQSRDPARIRQDDLFFGAEIPGDFACPQAGQVPGIFGMDTFYNTLPA